MSEKIMIDEKYTYVFDEGKVEILRYGKEWLGAETGSFEGVNAWISAANLIEELRNENEGLNNKIVDLEDTVSTLEDEKINLEDENRDLQDQVYELENKD